MTVHFEEAAALQSRVTAQAFSTLMAERWRSTDRFLKSNMSCTGGGGGGCQDAYSAHCRNTRRADRGGGGIVQLQVTSRLAAHQVSRRITCGKPRLSTAASGSGRDLYTSNRQGPKSHHLLLRLLVWGCWTPTPWCGLSSSRDGLPHFLVVPRFGVIDSPVFVSPIEFGCWIPTLSYGSLSLVDEVTTFDVAPAFALHSG